MNLFALPWFELTLAVPLIGAACMALIRDPRAMFRWGVAFAGATLVCALTSCAGYFDGNLLAIAAAGRRVFHIDELSAPLLPLIALLHFLTVLTTARTKLGRFSFSGLFVREAVLLATFACVAPGLLVGLLALDAALPLVELRQRGRPVRLYAIHAALFGGLLIVGWIISAGAGLAGLGSVLIIAAVLVRTGALPAQVWITNTFENGSFGTALLFATPIAGAYAALRLVVPVAPEWALEGLSVVALMTALYAAGIGVVERDVRRYFAYLCVSHASLVLVGIGLHTPFAMTGALVMWLSAALALTGLGLTMRAIEARVGALTLTEFRGLYDQAPTLAVCFLVTSLAAIGFPGTTGFVAVELLVDEAVGAHEAVGIAVVLAAALNGISVMRAYFLIFTGTRHVTGVSLGITPRERIAVLLLATLIIIGGLLPRMYLESRHQVADAILRSRHENLNKATDGRAEKQH